MSLVDIRKTTPGQLVDKTVQQILAFAGDGLLKDGNNTSTEFRELLTHVDSDTLTNYANQCLETSFKDSGLALQDIVNQVGIRLDFKVSPGRYRGTTRDDDIGYDGLWISPDNDAIIVEVKTTDAYRMSLDTVADYRAALVSKGQISESSSSILYVVGRNDTGDLEAQVRGSRHAWDIRLISIDALLRLMKLKEELDDPQIMEKTRDILTPQEFTRVDGIIDLVFSTAEEVKKDAQIEESEDDESTTSGTRKKLTFSQFRGECIQRISKHLGESLIKRTATIYSTPDESTGISCPISRAYEKSDHSGYWFAYHPSQKAGLEKFERSYACFGCGSAENILMIPSEVLNSWLVHFNKTEREDRYYWHVRIRNQEGCWTIHARGGKEDFDATQYFLKQ